MQSLQVHHIDDYELIDSLENAFEEIQWRIQTKNFKELYINTSQNVINGLGISWTNPNHPTAKYIRVLSTNNSNSLMEKLLEHISPQNKVIYSCWEDDKDTIDLLQQFQFKLFRKTYMERYSIASLLPKLHTLQEEMTLISLKQVLSNPLLEKDLFSLLKHNYEQTHLNNEAKDVPWETWKENLLSDAPDLNVCSVAIDKNRICAYIFVHPVGNDHCEIGWIGKANNMDLHFILREQLLQLAANGVKTVEFEIDTTDYFAYEFAALLDLTAKKSWSSYILNCER